ncbi:hypothetical protein HNQ36_003936 [Afipia massiliensis]|uniref:Uncharacterized protein n=1 Tax=Afipia massiliensis TaxID=211460 RepID=A0A840NB68_9BRAD|nr:hypothetical protein [Afipia massiliensis]MBB5053936.1 hypothetical protein [Afipia massiliensis]
MAQIVNDWRLDFMRAHPRLFDVMPGEPEHSFGYPLCNEGWREVLENLCIRIEAVLQQGETFAFVRIKQKMGILRVDWDGGISDETEIRVVEAVDLATARSACTCEICGIEGTLYSNREWLATRCSRHATGDPVPRRPGFENVHLLRRRPSGSDMYHARYDRDTDTLTEIEPPSDSDE